MLSTIFDPRYIKLDLESTTKTGAFGEIIETIAESDPKYDRQELMEAVILRENKMKTIIMPGIAVPHGYINSVKGIVGAVGFSRAGIKYDKDNPNPVHIFFMLLMDEISREKHIQVFSRLLEMLNSTSFEEIAGMETPRELFELISRF